MTGISFAGLGSGLPVTEIINATVKAQSGPLTKLQNDKAYAQAQISAYGQVSSRLNTLREAMLDLRGLEKFQQLAATPGNDKLFTAKADHLAGATNGNYSVEVLAEARSYRHVSSIQSKTDTFTGTLSFKDADGNDLTDKNGNAISIDVEGKTLDQVRSAINSHEGLKGKVSANLVNVDGDNARLVLNSGITGEEGRFEAAFTDPALNAKDTSLSSAAYDNSDEASILATSLDARIKIDGIEATSSTNTFTGIISGVDITLTTGASTESNKTSSLNVKRDDQKIIDNVNAFVKAYNDVVIHINEQKKNGMSGDSTLRTIESEMRNILMTPTGGDNNNLLALMGINTYVEKNYNAEDGASSRNGTLEIDNTKLREVLDNDFDRFALTFGGSSFYVDGQASGYAERFADMAQRLTTTTTQDGRYVKGLLEVRTEGLKSEVKRYDDRIESTTMRLQLLEDRLKAQFNAIEGLVANMNSTQGYLAQQMNSLPGYSRNN